MSLKWFCKLGDRQYGPLSAEQLKKMVQRGQITSSSLLRRENNDDWVQASRIKGLLPSQSASSSPASVPQARPAEAKPAPPKATPVASSPPQAQPPAKPAPTTAATPVYTTVTKAAPAIVSESKPTPYARRRKSNAGILIMAGAVVCGMIVLVGVTYLALNIAEDNGTNDNTLVAKATNSVSPSPTASAATENGNAVAVKDREDSNSALTAGLDSVDKWYDASKSNVGKGDVRVKVVSVWSADDNNQGAEVNTDTTNPKRSKYLFVQVNISNKGADESINYSSWNGESADSSTERPLLVDDQGNSYDLVPRSELNSDERLRKVWVEPQDSATDLLVFKAPQGPFESLRLVLPYAAVEKTGAMGFEIASDSIRARNPATNSIPVSSPSPTAVASDPVSKPLDPIIPGVSGTAGDEKATSAVAAKEEPKEKPAKTGPPTAEDLDRQFKEFNKEKTDVPKEVKPADE